MAEAITQALLSNMVGQVMSESISSYQDRSFSQEEEPNSAISAQNKLFKSADALLFHNEKISAGALLGSTAIWLFFEWVNSHFISLVCYALILCMVIQFFWKSTISALMSTPFGVPRIVLPEEFFANMGRVIGSEVNSVLKYLQDVSCGGNKRQFLMAIGSLLTAGTIAAWFSFLTMVYLGFLAAHIFPVLYTKYEDQINAILSNVLEQCHTNCNSLEGKVPTQLLSGNLNQKDQ